MPELRAGFDRSDAGECLFVFLRLHGMRGPVTTKARRLLRLLFIWRRDLPAEAGVLRIGTGLDPLTWTDFVLHLCRLRGQVPPLIARPTILRDHTSGTTARYNKPDQVGRYR